MSTTTSNIPAEMAALPQWVCAGGDKVPRKPRDGTNASPTNPDHWGAVAQATAASSGRGHYVGFCLTAGDPIVVIDVDACRAPQTGVINPEAVALLERFPTAYVEVSMSGTGLHIIGTSTRPLPADGRRAGNLEIYWSRRFIMLTGHVLPGHEHLGDVTEAVHDLYLETFPPASPRQPQSVRVASSGGDDLEDDALIERARGARNGAKFSALWGGDTSGHAGDESAADLALLSMLAFWTADPDRLDRLFRLSGRYRDKWERGDYRAATIARALERSEHYTAPVRPTVRPNTQDASFAPETVDGLPDDLTALKLIVIDLRAEVAGLRGQVDDERSARLAAEARADRSARLQSRTAAILGNPHLGQERVVGVALSHEFAHRESAGDTGSDGRYRVPLARVAERAGVSKETASRGIKRLEALGTLSRRIVMVPETIDPETGEIIPMHRELFVGPTTDALSFAEAVATIVPEAPKPKWGGTPNRCPDHPDAKVIRRTTWECAAPGCGHILGETIAGPMKHPATEADDPNTQDASFAPNDPNSHLAGFAPGDPEPAKHRGAVVDVLGSNIFAEWAGADHPPIPGTIAAEWLAGAKPHGEPGNDRWTR